MLGKSVDQYSGRLLPPPAHVTSMGMAVTHPRGQRHLCQLARLFWEGCCLPQGLHRWCWEEVLGPLHLSGDYPLLLIQLVTGTQPGKALSSSKATAGLWG